MALKAVLQFTTPYGVIVPGMPVQATLSVVNTNGSTVTLTAVDLNISNSAAAQVSPFQQLTLSCPDNVKTTVGSWNVVFFAPQNATAVPSPCTFAVSASVFTATATADSVSQTLTLATGTTAQPAAAGALNFTSPLDSAYALFF